MKEGTILVNKYAQAVMNIAGDSFESAEYDAIMNAAKVLENKKELLHMLTIPTLELYEKKICAQKLIAHYNLPNVFLSLLLLLTKSNRILLFSSILSTIVQIYQKNHNIIQVIIYTASVVSEETLIIIKNFIAAKTKKKVIASHVINKELIAGIRIESNQFVWDYSVKKQLQNISLL